VANERRRHWLAAALAKKHNEDIRHARNSSRSRIVGSASPCELATYPMFLNERRRPPSPRRRYGWPALVASRAGCHLSTSATGHHRGLGLLLSSQRRRHRCDALSGTDDGNGLRRCTRPGDPRSTRVDLVVQERDHPLTSSKGDGRRMVLPAFPTIQPTISVILGGNTSNQWTAPGRNCRWKT
jgi:hypothetical protein